MVDTSKIYEERDNAASGSYTLHAFPATKPAVTDIRETFIGNITFKRSTSGMQTTCFLHLFGGPIVKSVVRGCGYDVATEALHKAFTELLKSETTPRNKELMLRIMYDWTDSTSWKPQLQKQGVLAAHIGG